MGVGSDDEPLSSDCRSGSQGFSRDCDAGLSFRLCTLIQSAIWFQWALRQARFYSTALDSDHLWNAVRYVERNPVRAGMVATAEVYPWSSAAFHCGLRSDDPLVSLASPLIGAIDESAAWLELPEFDTALEQLRRNTRTGRPSGSPAFVRFLENTLERENENSPQQVAGYQESQLRFVFLSCRMQGLIV
jgi:hypothetical protein